MEPVGLGGVLSLPGPVDPRPLQLGLRERPQRRGSERQARKMPILATLNAKIAVLNWRAGLNY
jgi:hypothetical protein